MKTKVLIKNNGYEILPWWKSVKPMMKVKVWDYNLDKYVKKKMYVEITETLNEKQVKIIDDLGERENG